MLNTICLETFIFSSLVSYINPKSLWLEGIVADLAYRVEIGFQHGVSYDLAVFKKSPNRALEILHNRGY
jgi:hypothetical protein